MADLLTSFRADVPPLDPDTAARVRARLLDRVAGRPGRRVTGPVRVGIAVAAAAAVLAGGVVATGLRSGAGTSIGAAATAAEVLDRAAAAAAAGPAVSPAPGQAAYYRDTRRGAVDELAGYSAASGEAGPPGPAAHLCGSVVEYWIPAEPRASALRRARGGVVLTGPTTDPATLPRDPRCPPTFSDLRLPAEGQREARELAGLPTDPRALYDQVYGRAAGRNLTRADRAANTRALLTQLASSPSPALTPQLAAALFRAVALAPGVHLDGPGKDLFGRSGTVLSWADRDGITRYEWIVDETGGTVLGHRNTVTVPVRVTFGGRDLRLPVGTVLTETAVTTAVVDGLGERPTR